LAFIMVFLFIFEASLLLTTAVMYHGSSLAAWQDSAFDALLHYIFSGKCGMKPSRFGIFTLGRLCASITSFSPISLFSARM